MIRMVATTMAPPCKRPPHPFAIPPARPDTAAAPMTTHQILSEAVCLIESKRLGGSGIGLVLAPNL